MKKNDVSDYAKYFMQKATELDSSYDGSMKLQKLLIFSNLINMALNNEPLFEEEIYAFRDGCVVESIRKKYYNEFNNLKRSNKELTFDFSDSEMEVLDITLEVFDKLSAKELSDLNHEFNFWKEAYDPNKKYCVVSNESIKDELYVIKDIIESYRNRNKDELYEKINGITFYYDPNNLDIKGNFKVEGKTFNIMDELYEFSLSNELDDNCYSVYLDDSGELVIF